MFLYWSIYVPVLEYLCSCTGVFMFLYWSIYVHVLEYLCSCTGVFMFMYWSSYLLPLVVLRLFFCSVYLCYLKKLE